ncbi:MAG: type II toxin-antitoxin system VapC family toxin [Caldilinea sp.]|jgi:tRNA(fMet)-specific endonuclease VapC|uniref:type II toxin-antitoxin system VapC family toxin n=1 Tax=Caldilinea sp. TaxID=2293560 RepID=UPI002BC6BBA6|nr:type II toxin-antitoxin system VapC family toxin [Anaerolineales bacterium]HQY92891.1 type II toxin-antitoxin system VapC family toxin [Caldilinea sp.]
MTAQPILLDTDILSAIMRRHPQATVRARLYLLEHQRFTFSVITRYEVVRGLLTKQAVRQQHAFEQLCAASEVLPISEEVALHAAAIYADLHRRGQLIGDADILIAATAFVHGCAVATNNEAHYRRIASLSVDNWLHTE